jgi:hypothetical protein
MNPLQLRMATVGLRVLAGLGFVLAGGYALQAHGFGHRESDDIDLFTDDLDPTNFAEAVVELGTAYRTDGLATEITRQVALLADQREVTALDRATFAGQLRAGARLPDSGFTRYGATPEQIDRIRHPATDWAATLAGHQREAQPGDTYASMIPYVVPESLDALQGPTTGVIELPTRLDWGPDNWYDLGNPDDAIALYSKVISEASTPADLTEYLNRDVLVAFWPRLRLPRRCADLWNQAFPQLTAAP